MTTRITLLSNVAATGTAKPVAFRGDYLYRLSGTVGGATVTLQQQAPDGSTWLDVPDGALTAAGSFVVSLATGVNVRAAVSGGAPSALYATLDKVS